MEETCSHALKKPSDKNHKPDHRCGRSHFVHKISLIFTSYVQRVLSWHCCAAMPHHSACSRCGCACLANTSRAAKPPQERGWEWFMVRGDRGNSGAADSLFWVFSATSRAGCFLVCLRAHRHQLTSAAFVKCLTRTQPPSAVFPPLCFSGLKQLSPLGQCFLSLTSPSEPRFITVYCLCLS